MNSTVIRKLPKNVQYLICASNQTNTYTKAIQELVFNALDAEATSIAIRIHIAEGSLQVVDNGCGISQADFKYIGKNHMTSKLIDISTLKSAPNKYGYQGQTLANLVQISETLKVTSRFYKCETTCVKTFENGRAKSTDKCSTRPSKGTTIEIKGFLYNLTIQNKCVDPINELQSIKTFLEHISLIHSNISLSLRDNSKNEIVYKIHKNRDIYQTLNTLYEIEKADVQELQVEKNQYKVKGYVGKRDVDINKQFVFLNGKFVSDSSVIHKKINENFKKHLKGGRKKIKKNFNYDEENNIWSDKAPFYFIFITCPYMDYELTNSILEFKDWGQINTIIDKLIHFHIGDLPVKVVPNNQITRLRNNQNTESKKSHIEKIIQKILGNHSKQPGISQMQNGIKGKLIKRKPKTKKNMPKSVEPKKNNKKKDITKYDSCDKILNDSISKVTSKSINKNRQENSPATALSKTLMSKPSKVKITKKRNPHSKIKIQEQLCKKNSDRLTKKIDKPCFKKLSLKNKFAMETESVKRRCEMLAKKTEELIKNRRRNPEVLIDENVQYTRSKFTRYSNIAVHTKVNEILIHEYIPLSPKSNIGNLAGKKDNKLFKSNYDLLQTIISSQRESNNPGRQIHFQNCNIPENNNWLKPKVKKSDEAILNPVLSNPYRVPLVRELNESTPFHVKIPKRNSRAFVDESDNMVSSLRVITPDTNLRSLINESDDLAFLQEESLHSNRKQAKELDEKKRREENTHDHNVRQLVREAGDSSLFQTDTPDSNIRPYLMTASEDLNPLQALTFQSHNYERAFSTKSYVELNNLYKKPRKFITTQSRENFINFSNKNQFKKNNMNMLSKIFKANNNKRYFDKSTEMFNMKNNAFKSIRESYTIEYTESNEYEHFTNNNSNRLDIISSANETNVEHVEAITPPRNHILNDTYYQPMSTKTWLTSNKNNEKKSNLDNELSSRNTYTISNSHRDRNLQISFNNENWNYNGTYTIESANTLSYTNEQSETAKYPDSHENANTNFIFISKSQENNDDENTIDPIDVCETILKDQELSTDRELEFDITFDCKSNSCNNSNANDVNVMRDLCDGLNHTINMTFSRNVSREQNHSAEIINPEQEISHHFTIPNSNISKRQSPILIRKDSPTSKEVHNDNEQNRDITISKELESENNDTSALRIRNRMCFVPKGMSPIFEECQRKQDSDSILKDDCYADKIYDDFVDKVRHDTEIFKPRIQDTNDLTTKDTMRVSNKMNKENASLKFDGLSIKNAKVLGQIDSKFIAAIMKSKGHKSGDQEEFLVLFDQHAVHERIRLENNLADYMTESQWKSVTIDEVTLKMSRDDILYLHNYRDKFTQFGLQWNIINYNEISISAIPKGILGKNPRQVDKIIKAVKNLISEEINIIQMQRGCVSLYPKSIMDLVFSEACRYAIKFGDHLSKSQCIELISGLSDCKTPFQCAHGRPAMAVIMKIECNQAEYKINFKKLELFKKL